MDVADTKSNGAKPSEPSASSHDDKGAVVAVAPANDAIVTSIHRPAPGSITVVEVSPGAHLKLDFASTEAKFAVLDVDLVMLFPDGAKVILPGYAFNMVGPESTDATFSDKVVSPQQMLSFVDELHVLADNNAPLVGSKADQQNQDQGKDDKKETSTEEAPPAPPPQPAAPTAKVTAVADFDKPPEPPADRSFKRPPDDAIPTSSGSAPGSQHTSDATPTPANTNTGDGNVSAANLSITLLGVSGDQITALPSGGVKILGAASEIPATTDPTFSVQQTMRTLVGTAQDDIIYAANPNRMPSGTTERLIDVHVSFPDAGVTAKTATITNLPAGFAINNGVQNGSNWTVALDPADPTHLQIELRYVLPTSATVPDANGFLGSFNLNILFGTVDASGATRLYSGSQTFVIRDITSAGDVEITSADGKSTIYGLNATPPGANISAGAGNDWVYAGPGHDNIDGGTGNNTLSYKYSNEGVTVDLSTGAAHGGYAEGDVIQNFTNIEGSRFADTLTGTSGDNTFYGSGGGDIIIGNGGVDTVDYSSSTTGVSVNLTTGVGSGGLAAGDYADRDQQSDRLGHRQQHADRQQRRERHHRRRRQRLHRWRGRRRYAHRRGWRRHDRLSWLRNLHRRRHRNEHAGPGDRRRRQPRQCRSDERRCSQRHQLPECRCLRAEHRRLHHGLGRGQCHHRRFRGRHDRWRRRRRCHPCRCRQRPGDLPRHRSRDRWRWRHQHPGDAGAGHRQSRRGRPDQRRYDDGHEFPERRCLGADIRAARVDHGIKQHQRPDRRRRQRHHRWRWRQRHDSGRRRRRYDCLSRNREFDRRRYRKQHAAAAGSGDRRSAQCGPDDGRRHDRQQFHQCRRHGTERRRQHYRFDRHQHDQGWIRRRYARRCRRRRRDQRRRGQRQRHLSRHRNLDRRWRGRRHAGDGRLRRHHPGELRRRRGHAIRPSATPSM